MDQTYEFDGLTRKQAVPKLQIHLEDYHKLIYCPGFLVDLHEYPAFSDTVDLPGVSLLSARVLDCF